MGFFRTINKAKGFLNKSIHEVHGFGNKVVNGAEKGLHVVGKVANIANDIADKLTNVPIIGGLAGEVKPFIGGARNLITKGERGLSKADKMNQKFGKIRIK